MVHREKKVIYIAKEEKLFLNVCNYILREPCCLLQRIEMQIPFEKVKNFSSSASMRSFFASFQIFPISCVFALLLVLFSSNKSRLSTSTGILEASECVASFQPCILQGFNLVLAK